MDPYGVMYTSNVVGTTIGNTIGGSRMFHLIMSVHMLWSQSVLLLQLAVSCMSGGAPALVVGPLCLLVPGALPDH